MNSSYDHVKEELGALLLKVAPLQTPAGLRSIYVDVRARQLIFEVDLVYDESAVSALLAKLPAGIGVIRAVPSSRDDPDL